MFGLSLFIEDETPDPPPNRVGWQRRADARAAMIRASILTHDRQQRAFQMLMLLLVASSRSKLLRRRANSPRRTITAVGEPRWWS